MKPITGQLIFPEDQLSRYRLHDCASVSRPARPRRRRDSAVLRTVARDRELPRLKLPALDSARGTDDNQGQPAMNEDRRSAAAPLDGAIAGAMKKLAPMMRQAYEDTRVLREHYGEAFFGDDGEFNAFEEETLP